MIVALSSGPSPRVSNLCNLRVEIDSSPGVRSFTLAYILKSLEVVLSLIVRTRATNFVQVSTNSTKCGHSKPLTGPKKVLCSF